MNAAIAEWPEEGHTCGHQEDKREDRYEALGVLPCSFEAEHDGVATRTAIS
jgi:hypothetical protein